MINLEEARRLLQLDPNATHDNIEEKYKQYRLFSLEQLQHISDPSAQDAIRQHLQRLEEARTFLLAITPHTSPPNKQRSTLAQAPPPPRKRSFFLTTLIGCGGIFLLLIVSPLLLELWNRFQFRDCPMTQANICTAWRACRTLGNPPSQQAQSCWQTATLLHHVGTQESRSLALLHYHKACELKLAKACNNEGYLLREHVKPPASLQIKHKAIHRFQRACALKDPHGCSNVGTYYENLQGKSSTKRRHHQRALRAYQKACELRNAEACRNLALFYERYQPKDSTRAIQAYTQACTLGDAGGCRNLGILHERRRIEHASCTNANKYYQRACKLGDVRLCKYRCSTPSTP